MSNLVTQQTYIRMMSNRLRNFKKVGKDVWNCSCPICGDSTHNTIKARGYFIRKQDNMMFFCHNECGGMSFPNFLYHFDRSLAEQYRMDTFLTKYDKAQEEDVDEVVNTPPLPFKETMSQYFNPLSHESIQYLQGRGVPMSAWMKAPLYEGTTSDIKSFALSCLDKDTKFEGNDLRLVFPFTDKEGNLVGVSGRTVQEHNMRFITAMPDNHVSAAFNLHAMDLTQDVYILEGQMDVLFVPNSTSPGGLSKFPFVDVPKAKRVFVVDNQPRHKDVIKMLQRLIDSDERVVMWPEDIEGKDVNDMVKDGVDVMAILQKHVYSGIKAQLELTRWRKV
jgi:hypothetical protein